MNRNEIQTLINKHAFFTSMLSELIKSLLNSSGIKYHIIENRTKTVESLEEKIIRKKIDSIEDQINDISGLRIILYYQDDVDKIITVIKDNFQIDDKNSINKADLYSSNEFGYLSIHYIVSLDIKRKQLPEWKAFDNLKAEIQIRTVLQHSWASISHELTYKKDYEIPKELQRKLFRLAGLFELADEQFLKIRDEHDSLKLSIEKISESSAIETESINLLTLRYSFQKEDTIYDSIADLAIKSGFSNGDKIIDDKTLSEIIRISDILGFSRIHDIEDSLRKTMPNLEQFFKEVYNSNGGGLWIGDKSFYNLLALIYQLNEIQLSTFFEKTSWSPEIIKGVSVVVQLKKPVANMR